MNILAETLPMSPEFKNDTQGQENDGTSQVEENGTSGAETEVEDEAGSETVKNHGVKALQFTTQVASTIVHHIEEAYERAKERAVPQIENQLKSANAAATHAIGKAAGEFVDFLVEMHAVTQDATQAINNELGREVDALAEAGKVVAGPGLAIGKEIGTEFGKLEEIGSTTADAAQETTHARQQIRDTRPLYAGPHADFTGSEEATQAYVQHYRQTVESTHRDLENAASRAENAPVSKENMLSIYRELTYEEQRTMADSILKANGVFNCNVFDDNQGWQRGMPKRWNSNPDKPIIHIDPYTVRTREDRSRYTDEARVIVELPGGVIAASIVQIDLETGRIKEDAPHASILVSTERAEYEKETGFRTKGMEVVKDIFGDTHVSIKKATSHLRDTQYDGAKIHTVENSAARYLAAGPNGDFYQYALDRAARYDTTAATELEKLGAQLQEAETAQQSIASRVAKVLDDPDIQEIGKQSGIFNGVIAGLGQRYLGKETFDAGRDVISGWNPFKLRVLGEKMTNEMISLEKTDPEYDAEYQRILALNLGELEFWANRGRKPNDPKYISVTRERGDNQDGAKTQTPPTPVQTLPNNPATPDTPDLPHAAARKMKPSIRPQIYTTHDTMGPVEAPPETKRQKRAREAREERERLIRRGYIKPEGSEPQQPDQQQTPETPPEPQAATVSAEKPVKPVRKRAPIEVLRRGALRIGPQSPENQDREPTTERVESIAPAPEVTQGQEQDTVERLLNEINTELVQGLQISPELRTRADAMGITEADYGRNPREVAAEKAEAGKRTTDNLRPLRESAPTDDGWLSYMQQTNPTAFGASQTASAETDNAQEDGAPSLEPQEEDIDLPDFLKPENRGKRKGIRRPTTETGNPEELPPFLKARGRGTSRAKRQQQAPTPESVSEPVI